MKIHALNPSRAGLSLIETTMATLLVSITLVASLNAMAFVLTATSRDTQAQQSNQIAQLLLAEISSRPFADAVNATGSLGIEAGESNDRGTWDDCDDYHGWSSTTIRTLDGLPLANANGWRCSVSVVYCNPNTPHVISASPTPLKRIDLNLISPAGQTFSFSSLRCSMGTLLNSQSTGTSVLANVDVSLTAAGKTLANSARLHNQQEPN